MRILYDHQVSSLQDAGGATRYHFELARHLAGTEATSVELLLGQNSSVLPFEVLSGRGAKVWSRRTGMAPGKVRYARNEMFSALVAPWRGTFDIYHPTLYRAMPWVRRRRLVVTHHDCIHERFPQLFRNAASIGETKRKLFSQADAIICVSASSRSDLHHFYDIPEQKTHVVHHGFSPLPESDGPEPSGAKPYVLYVGSRATYKNFDLLLEAFAQSGLSKDFSLHAVGGGEWTPEERARIDALGLERDVLLTPKADDRTLARAYRNAALFVYPSLYEGFGFPPLEAMSMRCAVLVYRTSSLPEICGDAAMYFDSPVPEALAGALFKAVADPATLERQRALGAQRVKLYDWQKSARETNAVYRQALGAM